MKVNNVLNAVFELLGESVVCASGDTAEEKLAVRCLNMILKEIADEYVDFTRTEEVESVEGVILYSDLSAPVKSVKSVAENGKRLVFKERDEGIVVNRSGEFDVTYAYHPADVAIGQEITLPRAVTERALVYGTASEYCLMREQFDECVNLNSRYVRAIAAATRPRRELRVKERVWL